ncbi:hypothetical protein CFG65_23845 [Vibrio parahaemolyticus]|uniref:helix-turn-helix domain-containing protein n=1 Tax=Vibrio parahaemolyticus TaxID=670 RepID=UPI000C28699A|nr:hypothetical protein [Vibrio parahaemolyticus]PJR17626.1 hypothetical protein CFG65_23845 [Vibrio parahaemolyticus]HAS6934157.1 hypothetical protein [Vibrio parahaemolyticus]
MMMTSLVVMQAFMASMLEESVKRLGFSIPLNSEEDYEAACDLYEELIDQNDIDPKIEHFIDFFIKEWERENYESLPEFKGIELFVHLMQVHGLTQYDFPEIGKQPYISRLISGKATLQLHHIEKLSERFDIPKYMFLDG